MVTLFSSLETLVTGIDINKSREAALDDLRDLGLLALEQPRVPANDRDLRAHYREEVTVLASDVSAPKYDKALGGFCQFQHRDVIDETGLLKVLYGRNHEP